MESLYIGNVREKGELFKSKAKAAHFSKETMLMAGALAMGTHVEKENMAIMFDKLIELIEKFPDEAEFIDEALKLVGVQ